MLGLQAIASYIPEQRVSNYDLKDKFDINDAFIEKKIGVKQRSVLAESENTSDLCVKAFDALKNKVNLDISAIDCCIVVTQNPDTNLPHTSALVHGELGLSESCATFDISLGCSGYVYGLSVIQSFMNQNNLVNGLLFTADPYSKIIDKNDKNTALLFGDAATVSFITRFPEYIFGTFSFGTIGKEADKLKCDEVLSMNGRAIFNFAARYVPQDVALVLERNQIRYEDIDLYVFHQGSQYILDTITKRMNLPPEKVPCDIASYGNTVSSSIPLVLEKYFNPGLDKILVSGFGVGLSWATGVLKRVTIG